MIRSAGRNAWLAVAVVALGCKDREPSSAPQAAEVAPASPQPAPPALANTRTDLGLEVLQLVVPGTWSVADDGKVAVWTSDAVRGEVVVHRPTEATADDLAAAVEEIAAADVGDRLVTRRTATERVDDGAVTSAITTRVVRDPDGVDTHMRYLGLAVRGRAQVLALKAPTAATLTRLVEIVVPPLDVAVTELAGPADAGR